MIEDYLFKGKRDSPQEEWVFGELSRGIGKQLGHVYLLSAFSPDDDECDLQKEFKVFPNTVCRFTGLTDKDGVQIFGDDLRLDERGISFRIYDLPGGFAIKARYWYSNISNYLVDKDELMMLPLLTNHTQKWLCNNTVASGNYHDKKGIL